MVSRYLRLRKVIFDNGNDFKKDFLPLLKVFSIKSTPTTIKNPQVNSILERVYQVLVNVLKTENLHKYKFDDRDPWSELLGSVVWAICGTHHTTLQATPGQLVFGRDMLLNLKFVADWEAIKLRKQRDEIGRASCRERVC